jgi:hypothetical protein
MFWFLAEEIRFVMRGMYIVVCSRLQIPFTIVIPSTLRAFTQLLNIVVTSSSHPNVLEL